MNLRRLASGIAAFALLAGAASIAAAPAASARPLPSGTIIDNGDGTATVTYANLDGDGGIFLCEASVTVESCAFNTATYGLTSNLFTLTPSPVTVQAGMTISLPNSATTTLPTGTWTIVLISDFGPGANELVAGARGVYIGAVGHPIPSWVQGYGRGSSADACLEGWTASWELWPNAGTGGYVCTRSIPSLG